MTKGSSRPLTSNDLHVALDAAFRTGDQRLICCAVDVAIHRYGISDAARDAKIDRTSLHRAFRNMNGPALSTMLRVLRTLGFHLVTTAETNWGDQPFGGLSRRKETRVAARALTEAFQSCRLDAATAALSLELRRQANVSELARKTIRSRAALYKAFSAPRDPRFFTVLSFVSALNLCFGVARRSLK